MNERLKILRIERGLKLKEVAEALNVTIRSISRYEDGTREPSVNMIIKFCKLYDVSADYLLGLEDESGRKTYNIKNSLVNNYGTVNKF